MEDINAWQGKAKSVVNDVYFMEDPVVLKQRYIKAMGDLTINLDVNNLDMKSSEYIKQEIELNKTHEENRNYQHQIDEINKRINDIAVGKYALEKESKKEYGEKWKNY